MVFPTKRVGFVGQETVAAPAVAKMPSVQAKRISQLDPITDGLKERLKEFLLPTEFQPEDGSAANYKLTVWELLSVLTLKDLNLDKVDNTPDAEKPISRLMQEALDKKRNTDSKIPLTDVENLEQKFDEYRRTNVEIAQNEVTGLVQALQGKAPTEHSHTMQQVQGLAGALDEKADKNHTHALSSMQGWTEFSNNLNQALLDRPTALQVNDMIDQRALVLKTWDWEN